MITRHTIKKLEKMLGETDGGGLVIPIMATPTEAETIREQAKREGRKTIGIPINTGDIKSNY
jgi:hypothetical protein